MRNDTEYGVIGEVKRDTEADLEIYCDESIALLVNPFYL
jgi:hypothetical protein